VSVQAEVADRTGARVFTPFSGALVVLVGVVAFGAFGVLATYAPELQSGDNGGAHALSRSAVGYAGLAEALRLSGDPVVVTRQSLPKGRKEGLLIETPPPDTADKDVTAMGFAGPVLVILPKWLTLPDPLHRGWVTKAGVLPSGLWGAQTLMAKAGVSHRTGISRPILHALAQPFDRLTPLAEGPVDQLQTMTLDKWGWRPILVDERGGIVLAQAPHAPLYLLSDPDLLNNQGLKNLDTFVSGMTLLRTLHAGSAPVIFDVTLNGLGRRVSALRLLFDPPFLAVTLCLVAAAGLAGFQAFCRFGPVQPESRAIALGKEALVDNTAALVRLAGREHRMGRPYAELTRDIAARAVGAPSHLSGDALVSFLDRLATQQGAQDRLSELTALASAAPDRARLIGVSQRLFRLRLEITREGI